MPRTSGSTAGRGPRPDRTEPDDGEPDPRALPARDRAFEVLLEHQRPWADELVIYSTRPVPELEKAVTALEREFRRHRGQWDPFLERPVPEGFPYRTGPLRLLWEHEMFVTSLKELRGYLRPLRSEDLPSHRWALGQFWRLVIETLGAHLEDERGYRDAAVRLLSSA